MRRALHAVILSLLASLAMRDSFKVNVVRDRGVLDAFPRLTEADIYLWVMKHRAVLGEEAGHDIGPIESAEDYAEIMTGDRSVGDIISSALGRTSRDPDAEVEQRRRRRRLRHWPRPRGAR